jgi:hypothetical protein
MDPPELDLQLFALSEDAGATKVSDKLSTEAMRLLLENSTIKWKHSLRKKQNLASLGTR